MAPRGGRAAAAASSGSEDEEEEAGFSRSYFLAKEKEPSSGKKRARAAAGKLSDLNLVDEQVSWRPTPHSLTASSPHLSRRESMYQFGISRPSAGVACIPFRDPPEARGRGGGSHEKLQGPVPQLAVRAKVSSEIRCTSAVFDFESVWLTILWIGVSNRCLVLM